MSSVINTLKSMLVILEKGYLCIHKGRMMEFVWSSGRKRSWSWFSDSFNLSFLGVFFFCLCWDGSPSHTHPAVLQRDHRRVLIYLSIYSSYPYHLHPSTGTGCSIPQNPFSFSCYHCPLQYIGYIIHSYLLSFSPHRILLCRLQ